MNIIEKVYKVSYTMTFKGTLKTVVLSVKRSALSSIIPDLVLYYENVNVSE